jgi:hypothetical protein
LPISGDVSFVLEEYAMSEMRELTTTELDAVSGGTWGSRTNIGSFNGNFSFNFQGATGNANASLGSPTTVNNNNNFHELF